MVERYVPGTTSDDWAAAVAQGALSVPEGVHYLGSTFLPDEEACFCLFEAPSTAAVEEANRKAGMPFARIVSAIRIPAGIESREE